MSTYENEVQRPKTFLHSQRSRVATYLSMATFRAYWSLGKQNLIPILWLLIKEIYLCTNSILRNQIWDQNFQN
jgi:hypothetical protein